VKTEGTTKENHPGLQSLLFLLGILALSWPFVMSLAGWPFYFSYIFYFIVWLAILVALVILSISQNKKEDDDNDTGKN